MEGIYMYLVLAGQIALSPSTIRKLLWQQKLTSFA